MGAGRKKTTSPRRAWNGPWLGPISAAAGTVWRRWQDQAMREFSAFERGRALKLVTA